LILLLYSRMGARGYLRHCAKSRKVAGSNFDGVIGILIDMMLPVALWSWGWINL